MKYGQLHCSGKNRLEFQTNRDLVYDKASVLYGKIGGMVFFKCCHFTTRRFMYLVPLSQTYSGKIG